MSGGGKRSGKVGDGSRVDLTEVLNRASGRPCGPADFLGLKALLVAVLEDGIRNYLGRNARLRSEAECWILSNRRSDPFCFAAICDALGLDPAAVRAAVRRMHREKREARTLRRSRPNSRGSPKRVTS